MNYYCDLSLLPDPEFQETFLMNALYNKLHKALVALKSEQIGVSFPRYRAKNKASSACLGNILRLHSDYQELHKLLNGPWLQRMREHLIIGEILATPAKTSQCKVRRKQCKSSPARLRRRQIKRHRLSEAEAIIKIPDNIAQRIELPYLIMHSQSSGQRFCLFIEQTQTSQQNNQYRFNSYGLSHESTLPLF